MKNVKWNKSETAFIQRILIRRNYVVLNEHECCKRYEGVPELGAEKTGHHIYVSMNNASNMWEFVDVWKFEIAFKY